MITEVNNLKKIRKKEKRCKHPNQILPNQLYTIQKAYLMRTKDKKV